MPKLKVPSLTQEQMTETLDIIYDKVVSGLPGSPNCNELANQYLSKYPERDRAIEKFVSTQVTKCTTSGFVTGFGGFATMIVTLPANITSVLYVQMRMIATIATMCGYNIQDDEVQTLVYVCLTGTALADICKDAGIKFANKITIATIKKLPGKVLTKINQKVGFRFVTKFGSKGIVNLGKMVPVVGAVVGGSFDFVSTKIIAKQAYKTFALNEFE